MFKCLHLCIQTYPKIPSCSYILVWAKYRFTFLPSNYRRVNNFLSEFMWKNKEIPTCRAMSAGAAASTARPSFFFPFSRTRTHAHTEEATSSPLSPLGLLLVPNTLTRVGLSISQSSRSSPLPPSGVASRRSKSEFGPSSPNHQSGKYICAPSLPPPRVSCAVLSRANYYAGKDYILPL